MTSEVIVPPPRGEQDGPVPIHADDLEPGYEYRFGEVTVSEAEIVEYARRWDPIFIHTDPAATAAAGLGGVIASGLHTLAIYQRFLAEALWSHVAGGAGRSFQIGFRRPVRPGTTLTGRATIRTVTPRPERGDAAVVIDGELTGDGVVVLTIVNESVMPLSPGAARRGGA